MPQLRVEAREKLSRIRPASLGQASRISGITPADLAVLLFYLRLIGYGPLVGQKPGIAGTAAGSASWRNVVAIDGRMPWQSGEVDKMVETGFG